MLLNKSVAVIVPAFQEQALLPRTLRAIPDFVDAVYVVDDASTDETYRVATEVSDPRLVVIRHATNRGVGAALVSGYRAAIRHEHDVLCVMAGDGQMDPDDLASVCGPVARGEADYVKGNRFAHARAGDMPLVRRVAGRVLSALTRRATALQVSDTQCGYTALSTAVARRLPLERLWPRYGYPNDLLGWLAVTGSRVREVAVRPVYGEEASGVRAWHVVLILLLLVRAWWRRLSAVGFPWSSASKLLQAGREWQVRVEVAGDLPKLPANVARRTLRVDPEQP